MTAIKLVAWDRLDTAMQGVLLRSDSLSRKAVQSMIAVSGGGGGGGASVVGESPIRITDEGDGTGTLEVVAAGAYITDNGDGTFDVVIGGTA